MKRKNLLIATWMVIVLTSETAMYVAGAGLAASLLVAPFLLATIIGIWLNE